LDETVREQRFEKILVLVETAERTFRGYIHKPVREPNYRLSDYLNDTTKTFISLSQVRVNERGQQHRPGEDREYVAIAVGSIVYIAPVDPAAPIR
jgi:hypothetical protein